MTEAQKSQLVRSLQGAAPGHPASRVILARATTRDVHPTRGSAAIMQAAQSASGLKSVARLNVARADGSLGRVFCFDLPGFGWDQGEWGA